VSTPTLRPLSGADRRRSQRIFFTVPLLVEGKNQQGTAFVEDTSAIIVNAHGGLILLKTTVRRGQRLALTNRATKDEVFGVVVDINPNAQGVAEVSLEFEGASSQFWHVSFPPADWNARSPDAKEYSPVTRIRPSDKPASAKK